MNWKSSRSATQNARDALPRLVQKYFKAGRHAAAGKYSAKQLHGFRLKTKRFRYTLELFQPLYGQSLEKSLKSLHSLQGVLGKISDYATIRDLLKGDKAIEASLDRATKRKVREFQIMWAEFDAEGQLERWETLLSGRNPDEPRLVPVRRRATR